MITPYDYQREAVDSCYQAWSEGRNKRGLIVAPTASGKSIMIALLCSEITQHPESRVIVLTHQAELIKQNAEKIQMLTKESVGIFSAQLRKKQSKSRITVASIQSIYKKACYFDPWDVCIIDEAHLCPRDNSTMYGKFLGDALLVNPKMKIVGLSATIYRLDSGLLHEGKGAIFDGINYEISVQEMLRRGRICPIVSKSGIKQIDLSGVKKRGGEFIASELAAAADQDFLTNSACDEITHFGQDRNSWMIFCASVEHAYNVRDAIRARGFTCETIEGNTTQEQRTKIIEDFKSGKIRCLTNCKVLCIGFDAPNVDLIAMLTSTESTSLYVQIIGRGCRVHPSKSDCLLLDYGANVVRHGCFDDVRPVFKKAGSGDGQAPAKQCPKCNEIVHAGVRHCPTCGHEFPPPVVVHSPIAYDGAVLTEQIKPQTVEVTNVRYRLHKKIGKPDSVRVDYECGLFITHSEWLCPEHTGMARRKFEARCLGAWGIPPVGKCQDVLDMSDSLPKPKSITIWAQPGSKYTNIIGVNFE